MKESWSKIGLFFFLLVAIIGTSLRGIHLFSLPLDFGHLVHAHSHVAFQGWVYITLFLITCTTFLNEEKIKKGRYSLQLKLTVFIIIGVLVSFSLQGYGLYSIILSTLFQVLNYWFFYRFLKDTKTEEKPVSLRFVRTGLWLGLLSTLFPFGVGIIAAKGLNGSEIYNSFIYSFLHFQYNGWFLFMVIGLFFRFIEGKESGYDVKLARTFYWLMTIAVIPACFLSFLGMSFRSYAFIPSILAGIVQLAAAFYLVKALRGQFRVWFKSVDLWSRLFLMIFLVSFFTKIVLQSLSIIPSMKDLAFSNKYIVLAYLHLSLLGMISCFLIAALRIKGWLSSHMLTYLGMALLLIGFMLTETVLLLGGLQIFYDQSLLFWGSAAMALGVLFLLVSPVSLRRNSNERTSNLDQLTD